MSVRSEGVDGGGVEAEGFDVPDWVVGGGGGGGGDVVVGEERRRAAVAVAEDGVVDDGEEEEGGGGGGDGDDDVGGDMAGRGRGEIWAVGSGGEEDPTVERHS